MGPGDGNEVLVKFNGDGQKLQGTIQDMIKALQQFSKAIDETGKKAGDSSPGGGKGGLDQYRFSLDSVTESVLKSMGSFGGFMISLNSTMGVIQAILGPISSVTEGFFQFAETVGGVVVDALRQASEEIANLIEQVFDLNKTTEQATGSWRYIYGGGGPNAQKTTEGIMNWSSQFAFNIPYTRQDLHDAITALGRAGLSAGTVEQYMSDIADMGALNPQRNLTQAAWSIQGAMHGYSRMLKYDYGINPDELYDFGYDENNPEQTLLPALHAYLKARGMLGAAKYASTQTFWGAESSFVDRLQNFGLEVGGTQLNGDISKGSMFGVLKDDLRGLSDWWDQHGKQIQQVADLFKNILGGTAKDLTSLFGGLATGLHASGLDTFLEQGLANLGRWLNSPGTQAGLQTLGDAFGKLAGSGIKDALDAGSHFFDALGKTGVPKEAFNTVIGFFDKAGGFFDKHGKDINEFFAHLGTASGMSLHSVGEGFSSLGKALKDIKDAMGPEAWANLKWFLSASTQLLILGIGDAFKKVADFVHVLVDGLLSMLSTVEQIGNWYLQMTGRENYGNPGSGGGGSGGGGRPPRMASGPAGGGGSYTNTSSTNLHFYGASSAQVAYQTNRLLDERDRGSYLAKRTPGGLNTLGILG